FLRPDPPAHLCTPEQKLERFLECGMEYAFLADFPTVRSYSPEEFANSILQAQCHCVAAVCGFNYRFGRNGAGTPEMLGSILQIPVTVCPEIRVLDETVSSTRIRRLLNEGDPVQATQLLTRPYSLTAPVLHGKALGRTWGFPTVNQNFPADILIPRRGVYISSCTVDGVSYGGISNVGSRPTVDREAGINCETHLLDFSGDLYGREITVSFLQFLRPERQFESEQALREQIGQDLAQARDYFQNRASSRLS
ncbi:MAG: riboflavin biosynthesis protein RibF, partial [Clostridia bacterium]|nr:riboflavin biosynthesis protein RibF [Clostridia bacterium]